MTDMDEVIRLARLGRQAEEKKKKNEKAYIGCLTYIVVRVLNTLIQAWCLIVAVGVAQDHWIPGLPGLGYWWAVVLVFLLQGTFSATRLNRDKK